MKKLALILALLYAIAALRWIGRTRPPATTPAFARRPPAEALPRPSRPSEEANLAAFERGGVVHASSWDWSRRRHPLFLIDGELNPTPLEAWAPAPADPAPWIEVRLAAPAHVSRVVLAFAGAEGVRSYALHCLVGTRTLVTRWIDDARADVTHDLACHGADVVRLELRRSAIPDALRLYEIEVWGRP